MKRKLTLNLAALVCGMLLFTSCRKDNAPAQQTATNTKITGDVAVTLYKALTGQYGGASINAGIATPTTLDAAHNSKVLQSTVSLCGYTIDTTYNNSSKAHDTTLNNWGHFKFVFNCDAGVVDGYTLADSLSFNGSTSAYSSKIQTTQNYVAKNITPKTFSVNGQITSSVTNAVQGPPIVSHYVGSIYNLTGLVVDNTGAMADITSGQATFTTITVDLGPQYGIDGTFGGYGGTITFVGNHTAKLVINNYGSYWVNLLTGALTKI